MRNLMVALTISLFILNGCGGNYGSYTDFEASGFIRAEDRDGALTNYFADYDCLRKYSEELGMRHIDVLLNQIPLYSNTISWSDFIGSGYFRIGQEYAGFGVVDIGIWAEISPARVTVKFVPMDGADVNAIIHVEFDFSDSQLENMDAMGFMLNAMAAPQIFASKSDVGDFRYSERNFIRGNVHVWINRGRGLDVDITDLAMAIDQQILSMLRLYSH